MKIYINQMNEIKSVGSSTDASLKEIEVGDFMFNGMSEAKVCCHKVELDDTNRVVSYSLYVPFTVVDALDKLSYINELNTSNIDFIAMLTGIEL